jgi:YidC/Oxa1 family membrane protein insertase
MAQAGTVNGSRLPDLRLASVLNPVDHAVVPRSHLFRAQALKPEASMQSQQPESQKNLILAIALSAAVLMAWQYFYAGPKMAEERARQEKLKQQQTSQPVAGQTTGTPGAVMAPGTTPGTTVGGVAAPSLALSRDAAIAASPRIRIDTPALKGSIALKGGRFDDLHLVKYRETVAAESANIELFSPSDGPAPLFAEYGWVAGTGVTQPMPDRASLWTADGNTLTPTTPVTLRWDNGKGLKFSRSVAVDDAAMFTVKDEVENTTAAPVSLFPYARIYRSGTPAVQGFYILHEGLIGVVGEQGLQELNYADVVKDNGAKTFEKVTGGWLGFTDKYWATTLIPGKTETYEASFRAPEKKGQTSPSSKESFQTQYIIAEAVVAPGSKKTVEGQMFAGAKTVKQIEAYKSTLGIKNFDLMVDWGWFYFITKPLFYLIDWLSKMLGNFGLAILATTVLVKGAFFPLANKSYESMAKMKKMQPEMEKIKVRYPDKMDQQKALMDLYKKEAINPMAGCLPMLVQIPVFFALYKVLFVTIDMRHAPFYGWIKDLSAPDPTTLFNLFGLFKFTPPEFLHVGIWPLIMGVTMWLQMQLNPKQADPVQQQIFNWMPVMFTFMLGAFPAGLVIYWAWNNVLSIIQQSFIMKRQGVEVPLLANIGLDRWFGTAAAKATTDAAKNAQSASKSASKSAEKSASKVATNANPPEAKTAEAEVVSVTEAEEVAPTSPALPPQVQQRQQQPLNMGKAPTKAPKPQPKPKNKR